MGKARRGAAPLQLLYIGNSFTARNDLPGLVARLAAARGRTVGHRLISAGGASLRRHWNAGTAREAIRDGHFAYVVLQEQSTLPLKYAARMHENVRLFDGEIKAAGSRTLLYMTWARSDAPQSQRGISEAYTAIGRELGATVVPVGVAWQSFLQRYERPVLHDRDKSHPTLAGTYLAACVFLAVLFGDSPVGLREDIPGLDARDQELLQIAAWRAYQSRE
jgi:hypothetical protein